MATQDILAPNFTDIEHETGSATKDAIRLLWLRLFARKAAVSTSPATGGSGDGFGIIASPSQTSVQADQPMDQLNVTGQGITITLDSTTDTVDLAIGEGVNTHIDTTTVNAFWGTDIDNSDSPYQVTITDDATVFRVDTSAGDVEIDLDLAADLPNKHLIFIKTTDDVNVVRIYPASGDTIDDFPGVILEEQDQFAQIYSDNVSKWLSLQCCDLTNIGFEGAECLSTGMSVKPSAAAGVTVTPIGTANVWSSWVEIDAATAASWVVAGVCINPTNGTAGTSSFQVQVGTGAAGFEKSIGTVEGIITDAQYVPHGLMYFGAGLDKVPKGSRVSVRIRKDNTDTGNWTVKLAYFVKPLTGSLISTKTTYHDGSFTSYTAITMSGSAWVNSSWTKLGTNPYTAGRMLSGLAWAPSGDTGVFEFDIGSGDIATNVRVVQTYRSACQASVYGLGGGPFRVNVLGLVTDNFTPGEYVWIRVRSSRTGGTTYVDPTWIDNFEGTDKTTRIVTTWEPAAAVGTLFTASATPWADPASTTTILASTANAGAIIGVSFDSNLNGIGQFEFELLTGAAGAETPIATFRGEHNNNLGDDYGMVLLVPCEIGSGVRLSGRLRSSIGSASIRASIPIVYNEDFAWHHSAVQKVLPAAATAATVAANTTAWASSNAATLVAANTITTDYRVTGLVPAGFIDTEFEVDLLIDGVASYTIPCRSGHNGPGMLYMPLPAPFCVPANAALSAKFRKPGTGAGTWRIAVTYY